MRAPFVSLVLAVTLAAAVLPAAVRAEGLRVLASDAHGITLQVGAGTWSLTGPHADGRVGLTGATGAHSLRDPGHALLPAYAAMLAVPLDAHPTVRVLSAGAPVERSGVRLELAQKPAFHRQDSGEYEPTAEDVPPVLDGLWPAQAAVLGTPGSFRGRRLVGIEARPFQYDEAQGRLVVTSSLVLRVDFNRPAAAAALPTTTSAPDPHMDDVLGSSVLNFDQARAWRAAPAGDPSAAPLFATPRAARPGAAEAAFAFDESQPEVRVKIDSTGVFVLPYDLLAAKGFPAGYPIEQVSVHRHEFLEGAAVPYATIELPIEVDDVNHNGVFDSGDRIWLFARTWAERSGAAPLQRLWGDAEMVYATVKPSGGLRVPQRSGWRGRTGLTPLASYPFSMHLEVNDTHMLPFIYSPSDTSMDLNYWALPISWIDRPDTITFGVNDIDTTHTVQLRIGWAGWGLDAHYVWAAVKNASGVITTAADGVYWFGLTPMITNGTMNGSAFAEGLTHFLDWGKMNAGPYDPATNNHANAALNWMEPTYWRRFNAVHDRLRFNTAGAADELQIHAGGFATDSVRVYDITQPDAPVRVVPDPAHAGGGAFDLQDSLATGQQHEYLAVAAQAPLDPDYGPRTPPDASFSKVDRTLTPLYSNTAGDYLMIVPEAWATATNNLVSLRQAQGLSVVRATAEQVYDTFNGGRHSYAAIQRFIRYAYAHWSSRFVLLVGDGTLDPTNNYGRAGTDYIPVYPVPGPVPVNGEYEVTVSDNAYACVTGNCNPINPPGLYQDVLPELMVGRLPANTLTDVQGMVDKITNYENQGGDQSWRMHQMLLADDAYSDSGFGFGGVQAYCWKDYEQHFLGIDSTLKSVILGEAGLTQMNVEMFNERDYIVNPAYYIVNGVYDTCRVSRGTVSQFVNRSVTPVMFSHINNGTMWLNYQGHANEYVLTHEDLYLNNGDIPGSDDKFMFDNAGKPVLFTAFSCHANMFARQEGGPSQLSLGGCIGEDMLTYSPGGAIASWASDCYEIVPRDNVTHLNIALARALFSDPPRDAQLGANSRVVLGEAIQATFLRFMPQVQGYIYERGTPITYTLLGDPAQRISVGQPELVVHANDTLVVDGTPVRLYSPLDTLRLVADIASTVRLDSIGLYLNEGTGDVPVTLAPGDFSPTFPDTTGGGVSGGRRFRLTYRTQLKPETYQYHLVARGVDGLLRNFVIPFRFDATLRANGVPLHDGDPVGPNTPLSFMLVSPAPIDAHTQVTLKINGAVVPVTATPAPNDNTGREWVISWTHGAYTTDNYAAVLTLTGGPSVTHTFRVTTGALHIAQLFAFPNPFDNDGTNFSLMIEGSDPVDLRITVLTVSGRRIWSNDYRSLSPGYHQFPWNGNDAEGTSIANGTYFYRVSATTPSGHHDDAIGRMVKLRKPRHVDIPTTP